MARRPVRAAGCDLSMGMLRSAACPALFSADVAALPVRDGMFDVALAVHMLYHVPDRETAVRELRRVLVPGGACIAVTNGARHTRSLRRLVERAAGKGNARLADDPGHAGAHALAPRTARAIDLAISERSEGPKPTG